MAGTSVVLKNPFDGLLQDHRFLRDLLEQLRDLDPMEILVRKTLLRTIEAELACHTQIQELLVFPTLLELGDARVKELLQRQCDDHRSLNMLLIDVREAPTSFLFDLSVIRLRLQVNRHLDLEERELFPLSSRLSAGTLNRLRQRIEDREQEFGGFLYDGGV